MVTIAADRWQGQTGFSIKNPSVQLFIPDRFGPRVLAFGFLAGENILAELPEAKIPLEAGEAYSLRGGHRLWAAPEIPERTYARDNGPPEIDIMDGGLDIRQTPDEAGIGKSWEVRLDAVEPRLTLRHRLTNEGRERVRLAPWAVTMLRPGGVGLLPLPTEKDDELGLWPNRQLVIWPYTDLNSPQLAILNHALMIRAELAEGALKVGAPNPAGWLAYSYKGTLFLKESSYQEGGRYPDRGASHQIYCDPGTIELETLGPLVDLAPGESTLHLETWRLTPQDRKTSEIFKTSEVEALWSAENARATSEVSCSAGEDQYANQVEGDG